MDEIWANRLTAKVRTGEGKTWANVPATRQAGVKAVLAARAKARELTAAEYQSITGETYTEA